MKAKLVTVRGEKVWSVNLAAGQIGKRMRLFGRTKEEVIAKAQLKFPEVREHGVALADVSGVHRNLVIEWRERLTPDQMREAFTLYFKQHASSRLASEAVADYIASKTTANEAGRIAWSKQQEKPARTRFNKFLSIFGDRHLGEISTGDLEDFISAQGGSGPNYFRLLRSFFAHCLRRRWLPADPFLNYGQKPEYDDSAKTLLTIQQFRGLLHAAAGMGDHERHEPILASLVLGGLCGLRTAELQRLRWGKVHLDAGQIELDRDTTKKRGLRGRFVTLDAAALEWLRTLKPGEAHEKVVAVNDKNFRRQRQRILKAAKMKSWPDNALRRSFASHHLAAHHAAARTAALMGHTGAETTFSKYRIPVAEDTGKEWFNSTPNICAQGEKTPAIGGTK